MTTLSKLKTMKNEDIQNWLRKVGQENVATLVIALLGADEETINCVFRNMSQRAVTQLKDDLDRYQAKGVKETIINSNAIDLEKLM
jgi:flagellar motor switch protein FliG